MNMYNFGKKKKEYGAKMSESNIQPGRTTAAYSKM